MEFLRRRFLQLLGATAGATTFSCTPWVRAPAGGPRQTAPPFRFRPLRGPLPLPTDGISPAQEAEAYATFRIRDELVKEFGLDYTPHLHADAVIGWAWSVFNDYDVEANPLGFRFRTLRALAGTQRRIRHLPLVNEEGMLVDLAWISDLIKQDPLWLMNLRLTYKSPTQNFEISGWVENLTDQAYTVDIFNLARVRRSILHAVGDPRTYGVTVKVSF